MPPSASTLSRVSGFTRDTPERDLDAFNREMRQSAIYQDFLRANGLVDTGRGVKMTRGQQGALEDRLREAGVQLPKDFHIDQGGNVNQKNRLGKYVAIGAGAATAAFGIPGVFPGVLTGGGGAAAGGATAAGAGGGGVLPSTALGGAYMGAAPGASLIGTGTALAGGASAAVPTLRKLAGGGGDGGGAGMGASDWLMFGADYGSGLLSNWLSSRAYNEGAEQDYALAERRLALDEELRRRELTFTEQQWRDRYGLEQAQFGLERDRYGLERDRHGLERADWEQTRTNRAPYVSAGTGAVRALARGVGTEMADVPQAGLSPMTLSSLAAPPPASSVGSAAPAAAVLMIAPTGEQRMMTADAAQRAEQLGARRG